MCFLTMELVEGESLDRLIPSDGLPLATIFETGTAVADALAAAEAASTGAVTQIRMPVGRSHRPGL